MEETAILTKVYARYDAQGRLTALSSDAFVNGAEAAGWACIDEGLGDRYTHAQAHYLGGPLLAPDGVPRYRRGEDGRPAPRTEAEMQSDREAGAQPETPPDMEARMAALEEKLDGILLPQQEALGLLGVEADA